MKPASWNMIFICVVAAYFAGMALQSPIIESVFKPLLVSSLAGFFISATKGIHSPVKKWGAAALGLSVAGDTLLLFANSNEQYFILGLSAFLLAHIFYIRCFHFIRIQAALTGKWYTALIVGIYYFFIMSFLIPHLGTLKIPVLLYGMVISFLLLLAMQLYELPDNKTARLILTGVLFFVVSDSTLAINKFYRPAAWGGWAIMLTYTGAQWLLTKGLIRYISLNRAQKS